MNKSRLHSLLAASIIVMSAFGQANAGSEFRYRYKDTLWDGFGNLIDPKKDTKEFTCSEATGIFGDNYVQKLDNVSCYYDAPTVSTTTGVLPLKLDAASAASWCKGVLENSKAVQASEMIAKAAAAGYDGSLWSKQTNAKWTDGIVCSLTGTALADPPTTDRAGTLKLADFETTTTNDWPYWKNTSFNWRPWWASVDGGNIDPEIGGSGSFMPYSMGSTGYQDVAVDPAIVSTGFPVSVEWIQGSAGSNWTNDKSDVWLTFLDKNKVQLSTLDTGLRSPEYWNTVLNPHIDGTAPAGTAFVRVNLTVNGGWVDNVALKINGIDVSEINGSYGAPIRPKGYLKNADFEVGTAYTAPPWNKNQGLSDGTFNDKTPNLEDPRHTEGVRSLGNDIGYGYGGLRFSQQVWLQGYDRNKPFSLFWQQATAKPGNTSDAVTLVFYKKDGTRLSTIQGVSYYDPARFWQTRHTSGNIPADADFVVVDAADVAASYVDNIAFIVDGVSYSKKGDNSTLVQDACPAYINTVNGPADNRWVASDYNETAGNPFSATKLHHGSFDTSLAFKYYCVGPNDKWVVGDYNIVANGANAGFTYRAYDYNGNKLSEQTFTYSVRSPSVPERKLDVFKFPDNTAYLMVKTAITAPSGNLNYGSADWTSINLTSNGNYNTIPDAPTQIRNAAAQRSGRFWSNTAGTQGFISNTPSPEWHSTPGGPLEWDVINNGVVTTISCDTTECGDAHGYYNQMLFSFNGYGDYYQDAYIAGYNFPAGSAVSLSWLQSTASNTTVTSGNLAYYSMSMKLEFFDVNGILLGQAEQPSPAQVGASNTSLFGNGMGTTLPAGTFRVRLTMKGMQNYGAAIDDITLRINGTEISRLN